MAKLSFRVEADTSPVKRFRSEIEQVEKAMIRIKGENFSFNHWLREFDRLKSELEKKRVQIDALKKDILNIDLTRNPSSVGVLEKELQKTRKEQDALINETTSLSNKFGKAYDELVATLLKAQKVTDGVSTKLIEQKNVVSDFQSEVRALNAEYRNANKDDKASIRSQITVKQKQLEQERITLNGLRAEQERAKLTVKGLSDETRNYEKVVGRVSGAQAEANMVFSRFEKSLFTLGSLSIVKQLGGDIIRVRGEFQKTQMAFETMLGSKVRADALMSQMVQTAAKTPFDLQGVANGAKQLLAYGTAAEDVNDTLIRLGNIASGLSIPLGDMVYLYGTTQTQGRLFTQDVRQFMGRGIPLVKELAAMLGKTEEEINKMVTAGKIGFPEVEKVIKKMTDEGGKFYNLMEKQSQTLSGQISNLGDAWDGMLNSIGESTEGLSSTTISMATGIVENYERIGKILASLIGTYGAYKTAVILVGVAENIRYQATLAQMAGMTKMQAVTDILIAKTEALGKAMMLNNPYVLLGTLIGALIIKMILFNDEQGKILSKTELLKKITDSYASELAKEKSELSLLLSVAKNEKVSKEGRLDAIQKLNEISPKYLGNLSLENINTKLATDAVDQYTVSLEKNAKTKAIILQMQEIEEAKLKNAQRLAELVENEADKNWLNKGVDWLNEAAYNMPVGAKGSSKPSIIANREETATIQENNKELDKKYQLLIDINSENERSSKSGAVIPKTVQLEAEKKNLEYLEQEHAKLVEQINNTPIGLMVDPLAKLKLERFVSQIKEAKDKIDELSKPDQSTTQNKSYWEQKKKDAETARDALDVSQKNSEKWNKYTREIQKAQSEIAKYDTTGKSEKDADKHLKLQQELSRSILDSELKLQAGRISTMQDGKAKRIALAEQETKDTIAAIRKEREGYQQNAREGKVKTDPTALTSFDNRETAAKDKEKADIARIEKEYAEEYKERTKALTDVFLNEEERKLSSIKDRYDKERKWANEQLKTGGMTKDEHKTYTVNIDKAQSQETYRSLLDNLNDYKQKEKDLRDKWDTDIAAAVEAKDAYLVAKLREGKEKALSSLNSQMLQESSEWMRLFGNLDTLTVDELNRLIDKLQAQVDSGTIKMTPVDMRAFMDSLNEAKEKVAEKNPFTALSKSSGEMRTALKELDAAEKSGLSGEGLDVYKRKVKDTAENVKRSIAAIGEVYGQLSDTMKSAAELVGMVDEGLGETVDNAIALGDAVMNVGEVVANAVIAFAAGMNAMESASVILLVIKAVIMAVMAAMSLFNGDKKHERKIKDMQDQVENLERAYDSLGRTIENTYSNEVYALMDQQEENLRRQQALIREQVREEEAKKKTDKEKVQEYRDKLVEIDNQIEDSNRKQVEMWAGTGIQSAIDDFADALVEAYAQGEDGAKAMGETTRDVLANAVKEALKRQLLGKALQEAVTRLGEDMEDGALSDDDRRRFEDSANAAGERFMEAMGMYDDLFKDTGDEIKDGVSGQLQAAMTEGTASQLVGLWNSTAIDTRELKQIGMAQRESMRSIMTDITEITRQNMLIEQHTRRGADNTDGLIDELQGGFKSLDKRLENIERNTKTSYSRG